jgi:acyl-homoserine-lactone acylase
MALTKNRWSKYLLALFGLLALAAAYLFWPQGVWPFRVDLSHLAAAREGYEVEILRDSWGVPHIFGQRDADAAFGLAYAHAEDDFYTIQQTFLAARGLFGLAYGPDAAPNDYMVQLLRIWEVVEQGYHTIPPDVQAVMQGYADGLNYYAALHPNEVILPEAFPMKPEDVAAGFIHRIPLFFNIDRALTELFADERQRPISERMTEDEGWRTDALSVFGPPSSVFPITSVYGSNVFAVGPTRSATGEPFFTVNSHQPWEGPVTWYEAHMVSEEGWDMVGGLLPGSPTITHGHNRQLAWAFTVNSPDLIDTYVLEMNPDNPNQYRFDGQWLDLEVGEARLPVTLFGRFRWTVKRELLWSIHGPVVRSDHGVYALRYTGMGEIGHVEQFYRMNKASNWEEWYTAVSTGPLPMFNIGYADAAGNIYYVYNGRIPLRAEGYDWRQYLPGDTSETLWTDYLPFEDLPQVLNPDSGFIQNANSSPFQTTVGPDNPDPATYSPTLGIETYMTNRALRTLTLFGADEAITEDAFYDYKYDMAYDPASDMGQLVGILGGEPPFALTPEMETAVSLLTNWDLQATPDSLGATLAVLTLHFLIESGESQIRPSRLVDGTVPEAAAWESLVQAVDILMANFGRVDVAWQEVNRLRRGELDLGLGGAPDVLHAIYGSLEEDGRFRAFVGDCHIMIISWDAEGNLRSHSIHQYGSATLDENSPHYADQSPLFAARQLKPVWLDEADIRANLGRAYRP